MKFVELGSRAGAIAAFALFIVVLGAMGWVAYRLARQWKLGSSAASLLSVALFVITMALVYASSLGGFYSVHTTRDTALITYLPPWRARIDRVEVRRIEARPAFKNRWRVYVLRASGEELTSALADRDAALTAVQLLRSWTTGGPVVDDR